MNNTIKSLVTMIGLYIGIAGSYSQTVDKDYTNGRINMDAVTSAFRASSEVSDFERRINDAYEGNNWVLLQVGFPKDGSKTFVAFEDLDGNKSIFNNSLDDTLFTIKLNRDKSVDIKGYGVNGDYRSYIKAAEFYGIPLARFLDKRTGNYETQYVYKKPVTPEQAQKNASYFEKHPQAQGYGGITTTRKSYINQLGDWKENSEKERKKASDLKIKRINARKHYQRNNL